MKVKCILLHAQPFHIVDDNDGRVIEGISLSIILQDNLFPVEDEDDGTKGIKAAKITVPLAAASQIINVPGFYDVDFKMSIVKGKPQLTPVTLLYVSDLVVSAPKK